jgi:hypothetical protein
MQGRKAQKNASTTRITDSGEFDEHALIEDFRKVVKESELSILKKRTTGGCLCMKAIRVVGTLFQPYF